MLEGKPLVGSRLAVLVVLLPGYLQHLLEGQDRQRILLLLLHEFADFFIDKNGLFVVVGIFDEVAQILEDHHRLLFQLHLLQQHSQHHCVLDTDNELVEEPDDGKVGVDGHEGLLPVAVVQQQEHPEQVRQEEVQDDQTIVVTLNDLGFGVVFETVTGRLVS